MPLPELASELQGHSLSQIARQRLIHLDAINPAWTKWSEWFQSQSYDGDIASGTRVTSYSVALQIARKNAGVALGWKRLVKPMIDAGKLAIIGPYKVLAPHYFYLAGQPDDTLSEAALALKTWLLREANEASH